jgi:hypothetical protein
MGGGAAMARAERSTLSYQLDNKDDVSLHPGCRVRAKPLASLPPEGGLAFARAALSA